MKQKYYLGLDLGTSSIKGILRSADGESLKAKASYGGNSPEDWLCAMAELIASLKAQMSGEIAAVGLSSQVGTYVVDNGDVISWQDKVGRKELDEIKSLVSQEEFVQEIAMYHPDLISYPLPRLLYIQNHYGKGHEVRMPKEILLRELTGKTVTDVFSMRGIADPDRGQYAHRLMQKLRLDVKLPPLKRPTDLAGYVTDDAAKRYGLDAGIPVYVGCNDFFAGLLGMGIHQTGDAFDLSGTSEHIGYLSAEPNRDGFVSGRYFFDCCTYGGTGSSGASCDFAIRNFGVKGLDPETILRGTPPVFLPYLNGERAPIFDEKARGVYFGITPETDRDQLAYAVLEGVVFSLWHIIEQMHAPAPSRLICGGGSASDPMMNRLRATVFDCEVVCVGENDTSALGACMLAMTGCGVYRNLTEAIRACVSYQSPVLPIPGLRDELMRRFAIYKELYGDCRERFRSFYEYEKTKEKTR